MSVVGRVVGAGLVAVLASVGAAACARREPPGASLASASASAAPTASAPDENEGDEGAPAGSVVAPAGEVPSGPEYDARVGGPHKIAATATYSWVYEGPNDETLKLGYLRAGAVVDRGAKPVGTTKRCKKGWYKVAPTGFVCDGRRATTDLADPIVVDSWRRPARGKPLPYRYGRSREIPPNLYVKAPSRKEQERAEGSRLAESMGARPTESLVPLVGEVEPLPPFLENGHVLPKPFGATQHLHVGAHEGKSNPRSAFAFMSVHEIEGRLFGLSTELNLVPLDRVTIARVTAIHGGEVADFPAGLINTTTPRFRADEGGGPKKDGTSYERYDTVSLTGNTKGDLYETTDGFWVTGGSFKLFKKRDDWPSFAKVTPPKKWVDVSIHGQLLVAYEGQRAVYVAYVSTGMGEMADPETTTATKRGVFTIKSKHVTATMTGAQSDDDYELADVPYVQYFEAGYALHAAYWHENFGRVRSHGCINLTPTDAAWLFEWTEPRVPEAWHGLQTNGEGTIVYVHY